MAIISPIVDLTVLTSLLYLIISRVSALFRVRRLEKKYPQCQDPPMIKNRLPFGIDMVQDLLRAGHAFKLPRFLQKIHEENQWTFAYTTLGSHSVVTSEPENIQAILATKFKDFGLGYRNVIFGPLLGDGIFTTDGPRWEHSRALMRPQFARGQVSDLEMIERHVQDFFKAVKSRIDMRNEVDLQPFFFNLTIDTATEFLFGESVDSQKKEMGDQPVGTKDSAGIKFADSFGSSQFYCMERFQLKEWSWVYSPKKFRQSNTICHDFVDSYVDIAIANQKKPKQEKDMSKKYVFMEALAEATQDRKVLRDQLLNILLAGRDTTASLLSWTFYYLARHKRVWRKLREEVINDFGAEASGERPTFEGMKQSKYLQWVLNEALRIEPIVPWNGRQATRDTMLPTGGGPDKKSPILIKKGTTVEYLPFAMHRRKDLWGEDAEEFRPERWGEEAARKGNSVVSSWKYLPFNGGPRICLGQQFALTEASYVVIRLLQHFSDIDVATGELGYGSDGKVEHDEGIRLLALTMSIAGGCKVKLTSA